MYNKIINPETGRAVNVNGRIGKNVLRKYISNNNINGGGFFDFLTGASSNPMDEVNNIMSRINEAMQLAQAKKGEWASLNIIPSTKARETELLQKDIMKLQKYAQKISQRPQEIQIREQQKNQSTSELDTCNKQLLENELRCKSLEKTKLDTDTEYQNWLQSSSVKVAETLPQVNDIIDRITATDVRLKEESEKAIDLKGVSNTSNMGRQEDMSGIMTNESMHNLRYGNRGYGNQDMRMDWRDDDQYGGAVRKNNKKTKKPTNNKKKKPKRR